MNLLFLRAILYGFLLTWFLPSICMNHYQALNIAQNATPDEIKKAHRKLALENHPDKNPNDPQAAERMQQINEAKEILINAEQRSLYDFALSIVEGQQFTDGDIRRIIQQANYLGEGINVWQQQLLDRLGIRVLQNYLQDTLRQEIYPRVRRTTIY